MADAQKAGGIQDKIRQALERLGEMLDEWLNQSQPARQPIPVPVDRPTRKR
jgi:hypothetical protein